MLLDENDLINYSLFYINEIKTNSKFTGKYWMRQELNSKVEVQNIEGSNVHVQNPCSFLHWLKGSPIKPS